jgi:hypothetical protein
MSITCPKCSMTSYHPEDEAQGYCGNCHEFTSPSPYDRALQKMSWDTHYIEQAKKARKAAQVCASEGRETEAAQYRDVADVYELLAGNTKEESDGRDLSRE